MGLKSQSTFLEPTDLIDSAHPSVQALSSRLVEGSSGPRAAAVAIHDFVRDQVAFGFPPDFYATRASRTLELGVGYCNTKSTLFVALLRAVGIPSRIHFVDLDADLLGGIVDPGTEYVDHSYTEVLLDGRWIAVDSYIVDRPLAEEAQRRMKKEGRSFAYGFHRDGTTSWDGANDAFGQFVRTTGDHESGADAPRPFTNRDYGVHSDVLAFHRDVSTTRNRRGILLRLLRGLAFQSANARAESLRAARPGEADAQGPTIKRRVNDAEPLSS
ncbi:MAG: transglutaminase-like domain-containing protein [Planctomycetota bacterium]